MPGQKQGFDEALFHFGIIHGLDNDIASGKQRAGRRAIKGPLLKPQDGKPVISPSQDMVIGCYYLSCIRPGAKGEGRCFANEDEAIMAYNEHIIGVHQPVWIRVTKEVNGEKLSHVVRATAGRIIFNRNIPQDLGFVKRYNDDGTRSEHFFDYEITETCGKKLLGKIVDKTFNAGMKMEFETVDNRTLQYSYEDGDNFVFMDMTTYDQMHMDAEARDVKANYLKDVQ